MTQWEGAKFISAVEVQKSQVWETVPVWSNGTKLMAWEGSELPIAKGNLERFMSQVNMRTLEQWKPEYLSEHSILCLFYWASKGLFFLHQILFYPTPYH